MKDELSIPLEIISLGRKFGADKYIKKFTLGFDMKYLEIIPYHERWNQYCVDEPYMFGRKFSPRYYFMAYKKFIDYCDRIILFDTDLFDDIVVNSVKKIIKKCNKEYMIFLG